MAEYPALPIWTDAYLADTRHLTAAQHGAYLLLLMMAWRSPDNALPDDDDILARWACMDKRTWKANKDVILAFWRKGPDAKLHQKKLDMVRKNVDQLRNKNADNARRKWLKDKETGDAMAMPDGCQNDANQNQNQNQRDQVSNDTCSNPPTPHQKKPADKPPAVPQTPHPAFDQFWIIYPRQRRHGRTEAIKAYNRLVAAGHDPDAILQGVMRYAASDEVARGFAKNPTGWLKEERFLLNYKPAPKGGYDDNGHPNRPTIQDAISAGVRSAV